MKTKIATSFAAGATLMHAIYNYGNIPYLSKKEKIDKNDSSELIKKANKELNLASKIMEKDHNYLPKEELESPHSTALLIVRKLTALGIGCAAENDKDSVFTGAVFLELAGNHLEVILETYKAKGDPDIIVPIARELMHNYLELAVTRMKLGELEQENNAAVTDMSIYAQHLTAEANKMTEQSKVLGADINYEKFINGYSSEE